jgi:hypothetical protein
MVETTTINGQISSLLLTNIVTYVITVAILIAFIWSLWRRTMKRFAEFDRNLFGTLDPHSEFRSQLDRAIKAMNTMDNWDRRVMVKDGEVVKVDEEY